MRAAVLHTPGRPPRYGDHPDPAAAPGSSLVRVTAAPLVPLDLLCASGTSYFGRPATPYVPGVQGVGVVEHSDRLAAGRRVWFATSAGMVPGDGGLAEHCVVPDEDLVAIDDDVPDPAVAALGLSAIAAWQALASRGSLAAGESVLVLGGGGAVGQAGIGAARALGASHVVAVTRSAAGRHRALAAGADEVVAAGPGATDVDALTAELAATTAAGFDVVLDPVFGTAASAAARVLAQGGRLVNLGGASGDEAVFSSAALRSRSASVLGYTNNALTTAQRGEALAAVLRLAAQGGMAVAHETRPLADVEEAWRAQERGETSARLVLLP